MARGEEIAAENRLGAQIRDTLGLFRASGFGRRAALLVAALVAVIGLTAYMQIRLNAWNEPFYDALTRKDMAAFVTQLGVFATLAGILLVLNVSQLWLDQTMKLTLRRGLFRALVRDWMSPGRALRLSRAARSARIPTSACRPISTSWPI
ncbi:ABC transporter ATP-binding protein/permease [Rhodovulum sulfidophilum]|uniref:ABC transporter ATP-binding protein/permease n=1 Tax=Rhodovulum sulfidophilum TaxID=35806 RepID=A0A0D6B3Y2_RHOSU|nr:ABC transporter ATP-binding protein/permease [Rhodovulum sulfidophilum]